MNSATVTTSNEAFEPNLKKDPRLVYRKFRARLIYEVSTLCNDITQNRGLIFFLFSLITFRALPGNTTQDAAGNDVFVAGYDIVTAIAVPPNNASAITVKVYDMAISDKKEVLKNIAAITRKFINSLAPDDISELSDELYGMMNVTLRQLFLHTEAKYGVLNQSDFDQIFEKLQTLKSPTQEYSALAELHRDLHSLLAGAGQVSTEYSKTQYLLQALQNDPAGKYAIEIFLRTFPAIPDRTFEDLVGILILHAPTFIPTTSALGYSNAMAITGTSSAMAAPLDAAGLAQLISKHQKELSAMNKKNGVPRPRSAPKPAGQKYCYIHGYQKSHTGADCNVLKANAQQQYTAQHLAATDHHHPAGGNPNVRG
jgi:hypothetical protein